MTSAIPDKLEALYQHINQVILSRQHPVTGLFPASTSINNHGNYTDAWVRDNVYSIQAIWALYLANKRNGNPQKRAYELEHSCIKMMRGLLSAMMRQTRKVEAFKHSLNPADALHAKYDTKTGLEAVADDAWGHLQIDATSFYLLMLAQMTKAGSKIIFSRDEVNFVQNLIYYISRTYRTPDYGIWERGNKVNNGKAEINASSVGMAKAAMEALDGLNLFGDDGPKWAEIHSFADAVARASSVLASLLPKESRSKEVDSALLSIISFPAFAVRDIKLARKTRHEIINKLGGEYGCKRFLLDGHQVALEDQNRIYYEYDELINFEHIESEWPLFFTYLYIDRLFARDWESANHYRRKLESLMIEKDGQMLLPELYYVPFDKVQAEKENPGSQKRVANDNLPLVWAQSLYLVGKMLDEELITTRDLDPIGLHPRQHQKLPVKTSMVILAQTQATKTRLLDAGVLCQTLDEIAPLKVMSSEQLINTYRHLGVSSTLGLSGRPSRALNSMATSQLFCINEQNYLCLSWIQNEGKDYRKLDPDLIKDYICNELDSINEHWYYPGNAVFTLLIDDAVAAMKHSEQLFEFLRQLQNHEVENYEVFPQSAKNAFKSGIRRSMTIDNENTHSLDAKLSLHQAPWPVTQDENEHPSMSLVLKSNDELLLLLNQKPSMTLAVDCLLELHKRQALTQTMPFSSPAITAYKVLDSVYAQALLHENWSAVRQLFAIVMQPTTDLATYIADITVRQRQLIIGEAHKAEIHIRNPLHQNEMFELLERISPNPIAKVIYHELIAITGVLIRAKPDYFNGVRTIRLHHFALLCSKQAGMDEGEDVFLTLAQLSPHQLYRIFERVLDQKHQAHNKGFSSLTYGENLIVNNPDSDDEMTDLDWFDWRLEQGMITKLPEAFLNKIWSGLKHAERIIFGDKQSNTVLDCQLTLKSMTPGEDTFTLLIERLTYDIHPSWYKSLIFEALNAYLLYCEAHPDCYFDKDVNLPLLVSHCVEEFVRQNSHHDYTLAEEENAALIEFAQLPPSKISQYLLQSVGVLHE